jgi:hypothetical protein
MQREEHTIGGPGDIYLHTVDPRIQSHPKCFHLKFPEKTKSHQHIYLNLKKMGGNSPVRKAESKSLGERHLPRKPTELGNALVESPPCAQTMGGFVIHPHFLSRIWKTATKRVYQTWHERNALKSNQ